MHACRPFCSAWLAALFSFSPLVYIHSLLLLLSSIVLYIGYCYLLGCCSCKFSLKDHGNIRNRSRRNKGEKVEIMVRGENQILPFLIISLDNTHFKNVAMEKFRESILYYSSYLLCFAVYSIETMPSWTLLSPGYKWLRKYFPVIYSLPSC